MSKNIFKQKLNDGHIFILDGGMGTLLQAAGMPAGCEPARFCLERADILYQIHKNYIDAGSDIITSCTFGANRIKLAKDLDVFKTNRQLADIAKKAAKNAGRQVFVAGNIGPTGHFAKPLGDIEPKELVKIFAEQIHGLIAAEVDLIFIETQFDLAEARAAVAAARQNCDLPVMVSMTFEQGLSLTGSNPEIFAETMQNLQADVIGTNCSLGPDEMTPVVNELLKYCAGAVLAEPNAGLPVLKDGQTIFPLEPEEFAEKAAIFAKMGAQVIGGCCGSTPAHISALSSILKKMPPIARQKKVYEGGICLTSRSKIVRIGKNYPLVMIGERINPTGKPKLAKELANGECHTALEFADEQLLSGASVLDVNVGAPMVNEEEMLPKLVSLLAERQLAPLSLDSSSIDALDAALPYCPGSCLINSISGEPGRMEALGPLCRDFGAPFILLPLQGAKLPEYANERIAILERLIEQALKLGIPRRLILVDILALSAASTPDAAKECLKMAQWCRKNNLPTTTGLSNISFGMPARPLLNSVFLGIARGAGLDSCIINPGILRIKETFDAILLLEGYNTDAFIHQYGTWKMDAGTKQENTGKTMPASTLYGCVLTGDKENVIKKIDEELAKKTEPLELVNTVLIPAITEVGNLYERKEYFLPQLIRSAETMQLAFKYLAPLLSAVQKADKKPVVIMATVEGDIHDIGKNIVSLLLGNHGFEVIDAGKDVPAEKIVELALRHNASIIGLSALMTTTMTRMKDTIDILQKKKLPIKVIIGGAAVTQEFADMIGADAYCRDAVETVKIAKGFTKNI